VERLAKTNGGLFKPWRKCSGGEGWTRFCHGDGSPPNHHSELCVGKNKMKIFKGLSSSKNMVLNVKNLLNVGVGLMLRQNGRKK
jgi:hypothetical protein